MDELRVCKKCGETKPLTREFFVYKNKSLSWNCRVCFNEMNARYQREWRANNPDKYSEYCKKWYYNHHEQAKAGLRRKYYNNLDYNAERNRIYRKNNPDTITIIKNRRRHKELYAKSTLTVEQWREVYAYFNGVCAYCGAGCKLEHEHVTPISRMGGYTKENIIPSCRKCNTSKNATPFRKWYPAQTFYDPDHETRIREWIGST